MRTATAGSLHGLTPGGLIEAVIVDSESDPAVATTGFTAKGLSVKAVLEEASILSSRALVRPSPLMTTQQTRRFHLQGFRDFSPLKCSHIIQPEISAQAQPESIQWPS